MTNKFKEKELKSYYYNHLMSNFEKCLSFKVELKGKLDGDLASKIESKIYKTWKKLYKNNKSKKLCFIISHINLESDIKGK